MISDAVFYSSDGKEIGRLGHIEECELTTDSEIENEYAAKWMSEEWSATFQMDPKSLNDFEKYVVYGGDRGRYNGHVLKRDGYLSPENAWFGKDDVIEEDGKYYVREDV